MIGKYAVIGLGQFGESIARTLASSGAEVLAIDRDISRVEALKEEVAYAVALDATDAKALISQNIQDMEAVVVAIGENFECLLMASVILQDLRVKRIIARAATDQQRVILKKLGIQEILSPEETVGKTVAEMLLRPNLISFLSIADDYVIIESKVPSLIVGQTVASIGLREKYNLNLITIKKVSEEESGITKEHIIGVPQPSTKLEASDIIILMGKEPDLDRFIQVNK